MALTQNFSSPYPHQEFQALFSTPVGLCHLYVRKRSTSGERGEQISADLTLFFFPYPYSSPPPDFSAMAISHVGTSASSLTLLLPCSLF